VSTTAREPPELEVRGLSKSFNGTAAVSDVSFVLGKGEFLSLLGPSGCGKTTILRMLAGFVAPDGGVVTLRNSDITLRPPYQRDVGLLFQNYALFPHMTVSENVGFGPRMRGMPRAKRAERVQWALDLVRLSGYGERKPSELSGGQQQRVAVARVLAAGASVLLLDEPFSNLDAKLRLHMQDELKELQLRLKIPTIHVTHDQEEAMSLSDRLIIMNAGRIEQNDRPEAVYRSPANKFVAEFMGSCTWLFDQSATLRDGEFDLGAAGKLRLPADGSTSGMREVFVRPEHVDVALTGLGTFADRENVLKGSLVRSVYLGARTMLHVLLDNGQALLAQCENPPGSRAEIENGSRLDVHVPASALFPIADADGDQNRKSVIWGE